MIIIQKKFKLAIILDDHQLYAESFSTLVERSGKFDLVRFFTEEKEFLKYLYSLDVLDITIFLDFYLKDNYCLGLMNEIRRINSTFKIIIVSSVSSSSLIQLIKSMDPDGFVNKLSGFEEINKCINEIRKGSTHYCEYTKKTLDNSKNKKKVQFSDREIEVLKYFNDGHSIEKTAEYLNLSKHTIVSHRRKMMGKTNTNSIIELLAYARKIDLI